MVFREGGSLVLGNGSSVIVNNVSSTVLEFVGEYYLFFIPLSIYLFVLYMVASGRWGDKQDD